MEIEKCEAALEAAGEKMGQIMAKITPEKKQVLQRIMQSVKEFAESVEANGNNIDRSAMYAAGIIVDPAFDEDIELVEAAKDYIDKDYTYLKALKEASTTVKTA